MKKSLHWIVMVILLLSLSSIACGLTGGDEPESTVVPAATAAPAEDNAPDNAVTDSQSSDDNEPEATEAPTAVPEPTQVPEPTPEPAASGGASEPVPLAEIPSFDSLGTEFDFDSYRFVMVMNFTGVDEAGTEMNQAISAEFSYTSDPQAVQIVMSFEGMEEMDELGGLAEISMAQIGDTNYMVMPELGCLTLPSNDEAMDNPFGELMDANQFLEDVSEAEFVGEETINGIVTLHYHFDESNIEREDGIENAEGDIYIAKEGGYLVRLVLEGEGSDTDFFGSGSDAMGSMTLEMNLTDINTPIEIMLPAGCEDQGSGTGFPMVDDAFEVTSMTGMMNYQTALSLGDVVAFYEDELAAAGWEYLADESFITDENAIMSFAMEGSTLSLIISPDAESGNMTVTLFEQEEE